MDLSLSGVKDPGGHCLFSRTLQFGNDRMLGFCLYGNKQILLCGNYSKFCGMDFVLVDWVLKPVILVDWTLKPVILADWVLKPVISLLYEHDSCCYCSVVL